MTHNFAYILSGLLILPPGTLNSGLGSCCAGFPLRAVLRLVAGAKSYIFAPRRDWALAEEERLQLGRVAPTQCRGGDILHLVGGKGAAGHQRIRRQGV